MALLKEWSYDTMSIDAAASWQCDEWASACELEDIRYPDRDVGGVQ